jgi:hypothetical protein
MLESSLFQSFSGFFLQRWRPRNLLIVGLVLTFLSMGALLLSSERFTDNYFDVVSTLKGLKNGVPEAEVSLSKHPIELLVEQAQAHFKEVTGRQSTNLTDATAEYVRRYKKQVRVGNFFLL